MLKIDYLNNNEIFKNEVIACLNDWNNKTFEDEAITIIAIIALGIPTFIIIRKKYMQKIKKILDNTQMLAYTNE